MINKYLFIQLIVVVINSFGYQIALNNTLNSSITNYQTNLVQCSCNRITDVCDNYCCCDSSCTSDTVSTWTSNGYCLNATGTNIEVFCSQIDVNTFQSFEDLGCIYYSNRGSIGYFHNILTASTTSFSTFQKYAFKYSNVQTRQSNFQITTSTYNFNSFINILNGSPQILGIYQPVVNSQCLLNGVKIGTSSKKSCRLLVTAENCPTINSYLPSSIVICANANCSQTIVIPQNINAATLALGGLTCNNVLTGISITFTLTSTGFDYTISAVNPAFIYSPIAVNNSALIQTNININMGVELSGKPGYQFGKPLQKSSTISYTFTPFINFQSASACYLASADTTNVFAIGLNFNQPLTYTCTFSSNPCLTPLKIDSIFQNNLIINKYATGTQNITITGTSLTQAQLCNKQLLQLNILYSTSGWILDSQNYILSAQLTTSTAVNLFTSKTLTVNWIYVNPSTVSTPVENSFYLYWSLLWVPLSNKASQLLYLNNLNYAGILICLMLMFLLY